jgi:hypothetical protein
MTEFEKVDEDKNGRIDQHEWDKLALEDRRHRIDDENAKRDQQRQMIWSSLKRHRRS